MVEKKKSLTPSTKKKMPARRRSLTPPVTRRKAVASPKPKAKTVKITKKKAVPKRVATTSQPTRRVTRSTVGKSPLREVKGRSPSPVRRRVASSARVRNSPKGKSPLREVKGRSPSPIRYLSTSPQRGSPSRSKARSPEKIDFKKLEEKFEKSFPENLTTKQILKFFIKGEDGKIDVTNWKNHELFQKYKPFQKFKEIVNSIEVRTNAEHKKLRKLINTYCVNIENVWEDFYFQPVLNFAAGSDIYDDDDKYKKNRLPSFWNDILGVRAYTGKDGLTKLDRNDNQNTARYSGKHWYSLKAGEEKEFDPYKDYQIHGTNQFCQTYALMYVLDKLPDKEPNYGTDKYKKYYIYSKKALEFILNFYLPKHKNTDFDIFLKEVKIDGEWKTFFGAYKDMEERIRELLRCYRMTINCIYIDYSVL